MIKLFKRQTPLQRLPFTTDMHSHVLPALDDGSPDMETSLQLIKGLYDLGIRRIVATPHIIGDLYRNTPENINAALDSTKAALKNAGIDMEIAAAAEYMLDDHFAKLLSSGTPLLTIQDKLILTEQSYATPTNNLEHIAFDIMADGYTPIMAHPERYNYYHQQYSYYHRLVELGFLLQVNYLSLTGYYGNAVAKAARYILKNKLASFVSTDLHHFNHLDALRKPVNLLLFEKFAGGVEVSLLRWSCDKMEF